MNRIGRSHPSKPVADSRCAVTPLFVSVTALRRRDERFRNWFMRTVERRADTPRERLLAMFDALEEWFTESKFTGCIFINAAAEYAASDNPIHATSAEHKRLVLAYVCDLAAAAGARDPDELTAELGLLIEGVEHSP